MANVYGPKIVRNGLVLYLDKYNERSYLGEPTTNLLTDTLISTSTSLLSNWSYGHAGTNAGMSISSGYPDPFGGNNAVLWEYSGSGNTWPSLSQIMTPSSAASHTSSIWLKWAYGASTPIGLFLHNTQGGWWGAYGQNFADVNLTTQWEFFEVSGSTYNTGDHHWRLTNNVQNTTVPFGIYAYGPQMEQKSHATKFVDGTRSATDGWRDLTGNTQASGQTFDSDLDLLTYEATNVAGANTNNFSFDGVDDYALIRSASDDMPLVNAPRTLEAWFSKSNDSSSNAVKIIFGYGQGATNGGHCYLCHNYNKAFFWGYSSSDMIGTTTLTDDVMYHMVATSDGTTKHLYLNGVSETSDTVAMNTSNVNDWVTIGRYTSGSHRGNEGYIDVVRVYDRALTATEVLQNFNAHKGRYGL